MIGKLIKKFFSKKPERYKLSKDQRLNPTYPADLAEVFDLNRTEDTTDRVLWRDAIPEDKE